MKNTFRKTAALLLSGVLLLTSVSCAASADAMEYGSSSITENEFRFYLATYKAKFAQAYADFKNTSEFYDMELGDTGMSAEEFLYDAVVHNVKMSLVCDELFDEYGLRISSDVTDTIDYYIDDFITEFAGGSKNVFNAALAEYGINAKMLREIYLRDERASAVFSHLFGTGGEMELTDEDRTEYLSENYVRVRHIYVNNKYTYLYDEDGVPVYTTSGKQQTTSLSDDELAAKNALIAAIDESIAEGGDFEEIYEAFSEDKYYENGYYLTKSTDFVDDVVSSAFDLEIGEHIKIESDVGVHYIMRLEMDDSPWEEDENADFFENYDSIVADQLFNAYIESFIDEVIVDQKILDSYSVEGSPVNYRF